jgi:hypothetical protein
VHEFYRPMEYIRVAPSAWDPIATIRKKRQRIA